MTTTVTPSTPNRYPPGQLRFVQALALFSVVWAAASLGGWYLQSLPLIRPFTGWMPLQPLAAVLYGLAGLAVFAAVSGRKRIATISALAIIVLSGGILAQYLFDLDPGRDRFLIDPSTTVADYQPGRVAPNSALGFLLLGIGVALATMRAFPLRLLLLGMTAVLVVAMALIAIAGYLIDVERLYGWTYYPRMAAQTVFAFLSLGPSLLLFVRYDDDELTLFSWRPLVGGAVALGLTLVLWAALLYQETDRIEQQVMTDAEDVAHELSARIERHVHALVRMVRHWEHHDRVPNEDEWTFDSRLNLAHYEGYRLLEWIDDGGHLLYATPIRRTAEAATFARLSPAVRARMRGMRTGREPVYLVVPDPVPHLRVVVPVTGSAGRMGFASAVLDFAPFVPNLFERHVAGYKIEVLLAGKSLTQRDMTRLSGSFWAREAPIELGDLRFTVRLSPLPTTLNDLRSPIPWAVLVSGVLLSLILLWALHLQNAARARAVQIARTNRALTDEIAGRRQAEVERGVSQARYRGLFESIRDAIVVTDRNRQILACNPAFVRIFGYGLEEIRGRSSAILFDRKEETFEIIRLLELAGDDPFVRTVNYRKKDGGIFPGETGMFYLRDSEQAVTGYIKIVRDVTERERSSIEIRRRASSAHLLHAVAAAANRASTIDEAAQMALDLVCAVMGWPVGRYHAVDPGSRSLAPVRVWHYDDDASLAAFVNALDADDAMRDGSLPRRVFESGNTETSTDLSGFTGASGAGVRACVAFPVLLGSEVAGVLEFFLVDPDLPDPQVSDTLSQVATHLARVLERVHTRANIERLNQDLEQRVMARTAQLAASNTELEVEVVERKRVEREREIALQQEREARREAEAAQARLTFLADATVRLSVSLDYRATLEALAQLVVPYIADWCAVDILEVDGTYTRMAAAHMEGTSAKTVSELARGSVGKPCYAHAVESEHFCRSDQGCEFAADPVRAKSVEASGRGVCACIPLTSGKDILGVLVLVREDASRHFTDVDKQLAEDLVRRAALAIEHARLYQAAQEEILERRRAEESLAAESGRLAVTLQSIGDGVITTDTTGKVVLINAVAEQLTAWSAADAVGRPLAEVFSVEGAQSNRAQLIVESGTRQDFGRQTQLLARDGTRRVVADGGAPIRDSNDTVIGAVLVFRDITEQQRMEEDLIKAQKLESIGLLAGGIAHDFNNILTAILGNISLARIYCPTGTPAHDILSEAEKAFWRARALTQQLLTFARGGAPIRRTASIAELLTETVVFALRGTNTRCVFDITPDLMQANYDAGQMSQVVNNLVINAAQAMPNGGVVTIGAKNVLLKDKQVANLPGGRYVCVSIADEGEGIADEDLPKVFDPYFTTKPGGTGLGLATAYSIIKRHDGHIGADSELGRGSVFHVYLPVADQGAASPATSKPAQEPVRGQGRVLIMDDEHPVREVGAKLLRAIGYQVTEADSGEAAVDLYREALASAEPFSAVILDLTVPGGMGGQECARRLREIDHDVKAIVSSGYSNDPVMSEFSSFGFCAVVAKPYRLHELARVVSEALAEPA